MEISFDPAKRAWTLAERGLDFADAAQVFAGTTLTQEDDRFDYSEPRFQTYGRSESGWFCWYGRRLTTASA